LVTIKVPRYNTNSSARPSSSSSSSNGSSNSPSKMVMLPPVALPVMPMSGNLTRSGPLSNDCSVGVKFVSAGTAACIADMATFPLDTAKVRLQDAEE